ncbi:MAG: hypothetical protein ACRDI1_02470 [Actinomycetota bacterium]
MSKDQANFVNELRNQLVEAGARRKNRRARRKISIGIAGAAFGLLLATGIATAGFEWLPWPTPDDPSPTPVGPELILAQGRHDSGALWRVLGFRTERGVCLHLEMTNPRRRGGGCGNAPDRSGEKQITVRTSRIAAADTLFVYGLTAEKIPGVVVTLSDGRRFEATTREVPRQMGRNLLYVVIIEGTPEVASVEALESPD